ncbi:MAG: chemotaxis protein CheB [Bacteroidetes bacterium]|nr:chemotaxis protein CheB [Bacteroidota bacterium]MBU1718854.1 chemotaxis protein CheB [Bacteroidota bacterium]
MRKIVIIGGSAGSFQIVTQILGSLPTNYPFPVVLALHRLKHVRHGFVEALSIKSKLPVKEPFDKESIKAGNVYLAPANYHLMVDVAHTFSLSTEDQVQHSRPSIDVTFATAAFAYRQKTIGVILSGANRDGAYGIKKIKEYGGVALVQDPETCQIQTMTQAAITETSVDYILDVNGIIKYLVEIA